MGGIGGLPAMGGIGGTPAMGPAEGRCRPLVGTLSGQNPWVIAAGAPCCE